MPSKLQRAIAAVKDQTSIGLAKVSSTSSSALEVAVLKATTHDDVPVDEKYVNEVLQLVSSNKFHAAACARAIGKRIGRTRNWIVALKSLMLLLRIFQDGDPYFPREVLHAMKRGTKILNLSTFRDDSSSSSPWDFTSFVRTFALYLDERLECFLTGKLQRRIYTHRGRETRIYQRSMTLSRRPSEPVLDMKPAMLLDRIMYWQRLLDRTIATRPTGAARMNRLVQICLYAIVQESFELYKDVSDGLTLILDSFFHLQFQNCVNAFQACAKAAKQFKELNNFYALCKSIGVGRSSEYPTVQTISEELLEALQEFLKDQSSFSSNSKPTKVENTTERSSPEVGSRCTSLEDLIKATETGTCPAISIDLEAYSEPPRRDDAFVVSETSSTRSLPIINSVVDLMSVWDGSEQDEKEQQQQQQQQEQKQKSCIHSSPPSSNWELVLAETMSSSPSPQTIADNKTASKVEENRRPTTTAGDLSNSWELVLFEASPPPAPPPPPPPNNYYNPFLLDMMEASNVQLQPAASVPTFQAVPPFSMQIPYQTSIATQSENDPFAVPSLSSSEPVLSSSMDQQNLLHEQQLWLQNQNKIIAKYI